MFWGSDESCYNWLTLVRERTDILYVMKANSEQEGLFYNIGRMKVIKM